MSSEAIKRFRAIIHGVVQGVGYRFFAEREASRLNVVGFVRNLSDGTVEVVAEGDDDSLAKFLERLRKGPSMGYVSKVDVQWESPRGDFYTFEIRF